MYNKKLRFGFLKKQSRKDEDDPLIVEDVPSDDEWVANPCDDEIESLELQIEDDANEEEVEDESSPIIKRKRNQATTSSRKG